MILLSAERVASSTADCLDGGYICWARRERVARAAVKIIAGRIVFVAIRIIYFSLRFRAERFYGRKGWEANGAWVFVAETAQTQGQSAVVIGFGVPSVWRGVDFVGRSLDAGRDAGATWLANFVVKDADCEFF